LKPFLNMRIYCFLKQIYFILVALICLSLGQPSSVFGQTKCVDLFARKSVPLAKRKDDLKGANFLHQRDPNLHTTKAIEQQAAIIKPRSDKATPQPSEKILVWLDYLQSSYSDHQDHPEILLQIKKDFYEKYVAKPENASPSFFELQIQIAREQGRGDLKPTDTEKLKMAMIAVEDQRISLDVWLDYLFSKDSDVYPMWAKYWCLMGVVRLGKFDPETGQFGSRSNGQMSPFPELNREALADVMDAIVKKVHGKSLDDITDPALLSELKRANFGKVYGRALQIVTSKKVDLSSIEGKWVTYKKGSDPQPLVDSLRGMNTGWCTAGEETARQHLEGGDFHVFYSKDVDGQFKVPRIAVRMKNNKIFEIRGIAKNQNLDSVIADSSVLQDRLVEFGDEGKAYLKKAADMKRVTEIDHKIQNGFELFKEDLRFLYEIDEPIEGFGYEKDPRIAEILAHRNAKKDLSMLLNLDESEISTYHFGDIALSVKDIGDLKQGDPGYAFSRDNKLLTLPDVVIGDVIFEKLTSAKGIVLPKVITGNLIFLDLESLDGLPLPLPKYLRGLYLSEQTFHSIQDNNLSLSNDLADKAGQIRVVTHDQRLTARIRITNYNFKQSYQELRRVQEERIGRIDGLLKQLQSKGSAEPEPKLEPEPESTSIWQALKSIRGWFKTKNKTEP